MISKDTIVAISTARKSSGIGIIRISGKKSIKCVSSIFFASKIKTKINDLNGHKMIHGWIINDGHCVDEVLVAIMRSP